MYLIIELIIDIINVKISIIVCVLRDDDWMSQIIIADIWYDRDIMICDNYIQVYLCWMKQSCDI